MNKTKLILVLVVILLVASAIAYWQTQNPGPRSLTLETQSKSLGGQIYTQGSNPVATQLPASNPINSATTNPFDNYVNPFANK